MGLFEQLPYTNFSNLNLGELVKFINETLKKIENMSLDIAAQNAAIAEFKQYVLDYLDNLNVEQDVRDYIDELIANHTIDALINKSWLSGKKVVWYGDSWGTTANNPVDKFIAKYNDVDVTNRCVGGSLMTRTSEFPGYEYNSGYQLITTASDLNDFDYIFIMYGVNDWQTSRALKTENPDEFEFNYCVENVIDYLQTTYPNCIPVFIFQTYCYRTFASSNLDGVNYSGCNLPAYINNAIDICEKNNVKYINLFELSGVTRRNYQAHLRNDSGIYVHLKNKMSEHVADLIYWNNFNSGRCYGDNWSNNIILNSIDTAPDTVVSRADLLTTVDNNTSLPLKKISDADYHNMIDNPTSEATTIFHITFYKSDTVINGIYTDGQDYDETSATRLGVTNVNKIGLVDCYVEVPRKDKISVAIVTASGNALLHGCCVRVRSDKPDIVSVYDNIAPLRGRVTLDHDIKPTIRNGIVTIPSIQFTANGTYSPFTELIGIPTGYNADTDYFLGFDSTSGAVAFFYRYNGTIRNSRTITENHVYLLHELNYTTAH